MSQWDEVIDEVRLCVDEIERTMQRGPKWESTLQAHARRLEALYLNVCTLAAEQGNPTGQRVLAMIGKRLGAMAAPHGARR